MSTRRIILVLAVCFLVVVLAGKTSSQTPRPDQLIEPLDHERLRRMTPQERAREFERRAARREKLHEQQWAKQKMEFEQRIKDSHEGKNARRNKLIKKMLEVTEEQWKVIEPQIDKIYFLKNQSKLGVGFSIALAGPEASDKPIIEERVSENKSSRYTTSSRSGSGGSMRYESSSSGYGSSGGSSSGGGSRVGYGSSGGSGSSGYGSGGSSSGGFGGGGGGGRTLRLNGPPWRLLDRELTEGEKVCDELFELLKDKNSEKEEIIQKMEALRRAREAAKRQLAEAEQELRGLLDYRQEANLVLTRLLD